MILALALVAIAAAPDAGTGADQARAQFDRATELVAEGKYAEAVVDLEAIADQFPESSEAAESLFLAGTLHESHLDQPGRAVALYRRITEAHENSRVALAAARRLEVLAPLLGDQPDALAAVVSLKRRLPQLGPLAALAEGDALLARYPDWSGASQLRLWMAGVAERAGETARAGRLYQAVLDGERDPDLRFEAGLRAAELAVSRGAYDRAQAVLDGLPPTDNPGRAEALSSARQRLSMARTRAGVNIVAIALMIIGPLLLIGSLRQVAGSWRDAARQLVRPPGEAIYLAPLVAVFVLAATTGQHDIARAVVWIAIAGVAVAWLSGAGLRTAPPSRWRPIAHAGVCAVTVLAACFAAVHADGLLDLIISTVRLGPDV